MAKYKRGLKPILANRLYPRLARYFMPAMPPLPTPPPTFSYGKAIPDDGWGMDGNDSVGDCFFAAFVHADLALRSYNNMPGEPLDALKLYAACTGYDPAQTDSQGNNPTDQGTDPVQAFSWLVKNNFILAWAAVERADLVLPSMWAFGGHILGCAMPDDAGAQFDAGGPFDITPTTVVPQYEDHATFQPGANPDPLVTWGRRIGMTPAWEGQVVKRRFIVVLPDLVNSTGLAECGLNLGVLVADCRALASMV